MNRPLLLLAVLVVGCVGQVGASADAGTGTLVVADAGQGVLDSGARAVDAGSTLDAGPAAGIQISGREWAPNRDADGNVLLTDYGQLPANQWVHVAGAANKLRDLEMMPPYINGYGSDGFLQVVGAWGGAAWDSRNERLNLSGGGHGDASAAETEILAVDTHKMIVEQVVARQPYTSPLKYNMTTGRLQAGEGYPGGNNYPLSTGVPGSMHTYSGLRWLSPEVMAQLHLDAPKLGGMFYPGNARAVVNLDTGAYTTLFWKTAYYDISYVAAVQWKLRIIFPYSSFYFRRWDMSLTEMTDWQGAAANGFNPTPAVPAFGKDLATRSSNTAFVPGSRTLLDMPKAGQAISFSSTHQRVRYGAAEDADAADWTTYQDTITLVGPGAAAMNTATNFVDNGTNLLNNAGAFFLERTGEAFICPNTKDARVFRMTGLDTGTTGTVTELAGTELLTTAGNGTYGRFVVFERGGAKLAVRISGVDVPIEVMRLETR